MRCSYYCNGYCFWNGDTGEVCDKIAFGTHKRIKDGYCPKEASDRELEEIAEAMIKAEEAKRREEEKTMRSIIQSINPEHVYNMHVEQEGEPLKRIEVRKTAPPTPFKAYIYETKGKLKFWSQPLPIPYREGSGKIVGEYICRRVETVRADNAIAAYYNNKPETRILDEQLMKYSGGKPLKFLYMEDVIFYDKPKELGEFRGVCGKRCINCNYKKYIDGLCDECGTYKLIRPPQSWCYAEELKNG